MQLVGFGLSTVFQRQSGYRLWRQSVEYHHLTGASLAGSHPWLGMDVAGDVPHPVLHSHLSATGMECAFGWRIRLWFGQYALCWRIALRRGHGKGEDKAHGECLHSFAYSSVYIHVILCFLYSNLGFLCFLCLCKDNAKKWKDTRLSFNQVRIQNLHEIDAVFKGICTRLMQNLKKTALILCKNGYKLRVKDIYLIKPYARKEWNRLLKQHLIQGKAAWRRNQKSPYMPFYFRIKQSPKPQVWP